VFGQHHGVGGITFAVPLNDSRTDIRILPALNDTSTLDGNDTAPPNVTGTADRAPDNAGFYNKPVTVTWQGDDAPDGSGGISSCDEPIEYSGPDGEGIELTGECTDKEGNIGNGTFTFNYDATPPEISVPSADSDGIVAEATGPDGAQVIFDEVVTAEDSIDSSVEIRTLHVIAAGIYAEVKIIPHWDGYRPNFKLFLGRFHADLKGRINSSYTDSLKSSTEPEVNTIHHLKTQNLTNHLKHQTIYAIKHYQYLSQRHPSDL
jgi:hypothetical protein